VPELILLQQDGIGVSGDEFVDGQAANRLGEPNPLPFAIQKDHHEFLLAFPAGAPLGGGSFAYWFGHEPDNTKSSPNGTRGRAHDVTALLLNFERWIGARVRLKA
jgi:hypothetical protein